MKPAPAGANGGSKVIVQLAIPISLRWQLARWMMLEDHAGYSECASLNARQKTAKIG
jgi:hypothetical protein